ncbi:hypothetical protein [Rhodopseudomonas palustris]|uniref:hypothetical protein n=1 Tax=Rhodopseudomonas palustris TaxID=1076 RepID=UPI0016049BDA|nr:hypothetical protein [Rhodopseudomonas palustris]
MRAGFSCEGVAPQPHTSFDWIARGDVCRRGVVVALQRFPASAKLLALRIVGRSIV